MAKSEGRVVAVADAGPLIHLSELDALDVLNGFSRVLVPDAVWQEVMRHQPAALQVSVCPIERVVAPGGDEELLALSQLYTLHAGELEALALCRQTPGCMLLTDDTAARLAARALGLRAHGTIGVVVRAIRLGQRERHQVIELLEAIPSRSSLHVRPALLREIVTDVAADRFPQ